MSVSWADAFIDDQDVASEDFRPFHRIAFHGEEEGRDRIADQVFVDIETLVFVVGGRTRETGRHLDRIERQWTARRIEQRNEDARRLTMAK